MLNVYPVFGEIYVHVCTANEKAYVGQTSRSMSARWKDHLKERRTNRVFAQAIRKYSPENFTHQVVATAGSQPELDNLERLWIWALQTKTPNGYNLTAGGEAGTRGHHHTPEALLKIAAASVGRHHTAESKAKIAAARRGRKQSPEAIAKSSWANHNRKHASFSAETRTKMSVIALGRPKTAEHRAHIGDAQRGKSQSAERKANTAIAITKWWAARKAAV